jgi:hypothetical protein
MCFPIQQQFTLGVSVNFGKLSDVLGLFRAALRDPISTRAAARQQ